MPDPPAQKPNSKRKTHASFFDLFVSNSEIDKLRGELQLRQEVSNLACSATEVEKL